ncbi:MAG: hypothetical protein GY856_06225 [bacterium]|nr:hypothetical protein [bacterium]
MLSKEYNWLIEHTEIDTQYPGEYVAIVGDAVVAHGRDFEAVLDAAEKHGGNPLIHKIQPTDKDLVV